MQQPLIRRLLSAQDLKHGAHRRTALAVSAILPQRLRLLAQQQTIDSQRFRDQVSYGVCEPWSHTT
ncbi:hypothetical protein HN371_00315 [Candidatus Poribacteria bacterium]|nr:hypothetical protein [Candidatus Poribacteria bacterium]